MLCKGFLKSSTIRLFSHSYSEESKNHLQHFLRVLDLDRRGLGHRGTFGRPPLPSLNLRLGEVVHSGKFDEGREDECEAYSYEPVHCCGVRDLGEGVASADAQRRHGQNSGDTCSGKEKEKVWSLRNTFRMKKGEARNDFLMLLPNGYASFAQCSIAHVFISIFH